ncbi:hypothetical protein AI46_26530 [Burkholderia multivorans R-20526]|nr:hypothetical protein AI46_26530 [Burkholderia multivorans R-20526]
MRMLRGCTWDRIDTNTRGIGLIADDVYTAFGEFVYISEPEKTLPDGTVINDVKAVDTGGVGVALHHEAILVLMDEIDSMRKRVAELEAKDTP